MKKFLKLLKGKSTLKNLFILGILLFSQQLLAMDAYLPQTEGSSAPTPPQAEGSTESTPPPTITQFNEINTLEQVLGYISILTGENASNPSEILVVLDWDNTISRVNGCSLPLREGLNTQNIINELVREGIPVAIMTARLNGSGAFEEKDNTQIINQNIAEPMLQSALNMEKALGFPLPNIFGKYVENKIIKPGFSIGQYAYKLGDNYYNFLIHNSIIFAGGPSTIIKGGILKILLEGKFFKKQPKHIIFVDNSLENVKGVVSTLPASNVDVIGLYFPEEEERDDFENCTLSP